MNFTAEQRKPLRDCNLNRLKEELGRENDEGAETPAKIPKLDPDAQPALKFETLDGLVVACRRPSSIAKELARLVKPSGNLVFYCPHIEVTTGRYA